MDFGRLETFFEKIPSVSFGILDFLDICLVAFVIYHGLKLIRETRAIQLVKGLLLMLVCYAFVVVFNMQASDVLFKYLFKNIFIILVVVFQQEIRQLIEKIGTSRFSGLGSLFKSDTDYENETVRNSIIEICKAVQRMSDSRTGALIVMERETLIGDVIKTGIHIDAEISHELIGNIFYSGSPLHDGAAVVRQGRLLCAGCVLPLTKNDNISSDLGTRHRAALGMSEACDAMIIVVSEETGMISVAKEGRFKRGYSEADLRETLLDYYIDSSAKGKKNDITIIRKIFKDKKK